MTKTLQVILEEEEHKNFKLWCTSKNTTMAEFVRKLVLACIEGFNPNDVIKRTAMIDSCKHTELTTASGVVIRLPIPNLVEKEGTQTVVTVPDDTAEEDIEMIGTVPNTLVKTNKEWRTEIPMEVKA
jgi:hypothetical protein